MRIMLHKKSIFDKTGIWRCCEGQEELFCERIKAIDQVFKNQ